MSYATSNDVLKAREQPLLLLSSGWNVEVKASAGGSHLGAVELESLLRPATSAQDCPLEDFCCDRSELREFKPLSCRFLVPGSWPSS